ncbi:MAG: isoprenyl transferase [Pseudobdellovibrionaceae bacterium]
MILPKHVGIIMDGNGRWAESLGRPRTFGHIKGARVAKKIITACAQKGIENLTLYAFSSENWFRPQVEVSFLMTLLKRHLQKEKNSLVKQNIRFSAIGELDRLPDDVRKEIVSATEMTKNNTGMNLIFAISYGSRQEMMSTIQKLAHQVQHGLLQPEDITEELISKSLWTAGIQDPDLIIRTSGESRLSNFMMWQAAYSELYFTETLWPDFNEEEFDKALSEFRLRERRFGKVAPNKNASLLSLIPKSLSASL